MNARRFLLGRTWTIEEIQADCAEARRLFRVRRTEKPLEEYLAEYTSAKAAADELIGSLPRLLARPADSEFVAQLCSNQASFMALRYIAAPPISEDDLDTLLDARLSPTAIRNSPSLADALIALLRDTLDPRRFQWIVDGRSPSAEEVRTASVATAVATTIQRVQTKRRSDEKSELEESVARLLDTMHYRKLPTPRAALHSLEELPGPLQYMRGATLGDDNADFVIGLGDRRRLALECKSSNSAINSRKRLNKEVVKDAEKWREQFGNQVVAAAALRGVFSARYVMDAQEAPLLIFWGHRLEDLQSFLDATSHRGG